MARADPPAAVEGRQRGIIVLDLVLAAAVLALIVLVALPSLPRGTTPARHAGYVLEVAAVLKSDRTAAARTSREMATRIDVAARRITGSSNGQVVQLPGDLSLDVVASDLCAAGAGRFAIAFGADGRSCGAVIRIGKGTQDWRIRINWLTGFVDVVAPQSG